MLNIFQHPLFAGRRWPLSSDEIRNAAERLDQAEKSRKQIRQLSLEFPGITIEDAYAIQKAWV